MDFVYTGPWSAELQSQLRSWIDGKWRSWGEESPGGELIDFIKESLENKKKVEEFVNDFLELEFGEDKARELARELGELLVKYQMSISRPEAKSSMQMGALKASRESRPPQPRSQSSLPVDSALSSSRTSSKSSHGPRGSDERIGSLPKNMASRLGKRTADTRTEDNDEREPKRPHVSSALDAQLRQMEELNRVAVASGFKNAKEMLEMTSGQNVAPASAHPAMYAYPAHATYAPYPNNAEAEGGQRDPFFRGGRGGGRGRGVGGRHNPYRYEYRHNKTTTPTTAEVPVASSDSQIPEDKKDFTEKIESQREKAQVPQHPAAAPSAETSRSSYHWVGNSSAGNNPFAQANNAPSSKVPPASTAPGGFAPEVGGRFSAGRGGRGGRGVDGRFQMGRGHPHAARGGANKVWVRQPDVDESLPVSR